MILFRHIPVRLLPLFCFLVLHPLTSHAAIFRVNSVEDIGDLTPGNGLCVAYVIISPPFVFPFCTLRAAIEEANALPGTDRVTLPSGEFRLLRQGINEDLGLLGDLDITDDLIISGAGENETIIDGGEMDRVIDIFGSDNQVTISGLTIQNGRLPQGLNEDQAGGAGIRNAGILRITNARISGNRANGASGADAGGGLLNSGSCLLANSTIENNRAARGGGIANLNGAGMKLDASTVNSNMAVSGAGLSNEGTASVINSTISGNRAEDSASSHGGGILNLGDLELTQSTVAKNLAATTGGGVSNEGSIDMVNTLLADNKGGNCKPARVITSLGYNLDSDNTCGCAEPTDLIGVNPRLDTLGPHGGPTNTHGLLLGSPAVDRGKDLHAAAIITDQRGVPRPQGNAYDIGSFETSPRSVAPLISLLLRQTPKTSLAAHRKDN